MEVKSYLNRKHEMFLNILTGVILFFGIILNRKHEMFLNVTTGKHHNMFLT